MVRFVAASAGSAIIPYAPGVTNSITLYAQTGLQSIPDHLL